MTQSVEYLKTRRLASDISKWYFKNNINKTFDLNKLPINKTSQRNPKYKEDMWAKLMTEAILSFSQGLDDRVEPEGKRANSVKIYEDAVEFVGSEAFNTIAYIVSASILKKAQRPTIEDPKVEQQLVNLEKQFAGIDPMTLIKNQIDQRVIGKASSILVDEWNFLNNQLAVQNAAQNMQSLSATTNLSPDLAKFLGGKGTYYQIIADALTRQSAQLGQPTQEKGLFYQGRR